MKGHEPDEDGQEPALRGRAGFARLTRSARAPVPKRGIRTLAPARAEILPVRVDAWDDLGTLPVNPRLLERHRLISATRHDAAHVAFDVLRTRLLQALAERGWRRVGITSPTKNCGKSFVAANLGLSLSRQKSVRTVLLDLDLRKPSLARLFGAAEPRPIAPFLAGETRAQDHFLRLGENLLKIGQTLALGLNERAEPDASELLQQPATARALQDMRRDLRPDVELYDLPPALYHDDVLAFRPQVDAVLLVIGGGVTKAEEVREVSRRLSDRTPLLGTVLNRAEGPSISDYSY